MSHGGQVVEILCTSMNRLAVELDVSYATVRAWAAGSRRPGRENQGRLAALARIRAHQLLALARELEGGGDPGAWPSGDRLIAEHRALQRENRVLAAALRRQAGSLRRP